MSWAALAALLLLLSGCVVAVEGSFTCKGAQVDCSFQMKRAAEAV